MERRLEIKEEADSMLKLMLTSNVEIRDKRRRRR
jgi:hypothetical protein